MNYTIGKYYRYYFGKRKFKLIDVSETGIFRFECGHWCTDNVFCDMVDCETGLQVYENVQIKYFN